jgi:hypothetical protein
VLQGVTDRERAALAEPEDDRGVRPGTGGDRGQVGYPLGHGRRR